MQSQVLQARDREALAHVVWLKVFQGQGRPEQLASALNVDEAQVQRALERRDGVWVPRTLHIPMGSNSGSEAAMLDHFRAVCNVLTSRSRAFLEPSSDEGLGTPQARGTDGGSTFSFSVYPGHPHEAEVLGLLDRTRKDTQRLWEQVAGHNEQTAPPADARKVTFHCGQVSAGPDDEVEARDNE